MSNVSIPNLDGLNLPLALTNAVRQAFMEIQSLASQTTSASSVTGNPFVQYQLLNSATVQINPPNTNATDWVLVLLQDATGGRVFTFGPGISYSSFKISTTANTLSVLRLTLSSVKSSQLWVLSGQPITGMSLTNSANLTPLLNGAGTVTFPENSSPAKVSASSGALTLASGGTNQNVVITPSGSGIISSTASLGLGSAPISTSAGRLYVTIKGSSDAGILELATGAADADLTLIGQLQGVDVHNLDAVIRAASIQFLQQGPTANHRGGQIRLITKADSGTPTAWWILDRQGFGGFGGNLTPAYAVDATGDVNASGVHRTGGTAGISATNSGNSLTATGGIVTSLSSFTTVSLTNQSATVGPNNLLVDSAKAPAGLYRITMYSDTHTAGTGNVIFSVSTNDGIGVKTLSANLVLTAGNLATSTFILRSDGSTNITYTATYAASGAYDVYMQLERVT